MSPLRRGLGWLADHVEEAIAAAVLAVMAGVAFVNVVTRYLVHYPLAFTEELEVSLFVWLVLLGTAMAFRHDAHLKVVFFADRLPPAWQRAVRLVASGASLLLFGILLVLGYRQVADEILLGVVTESLGWPSWVFTSGLPVGAGLVGIRILQSSWRLIRQQGEVLGAVEPSAHSGDVRGDGDPRGVGL
ncbi:TRAP transporter small permease [Limnochorda pilosa]|uniref:TRAP transporter n=1 Tax=Limnochorda pilosa TaxID=1555112 RepID=A0A0K2SG93_LIMPI|nr:TRAP transporter small permease [Limnochorda pilosa]BAS26121.1 TRAP transporter [Limnochorda pilosa]